MSDQTKKTSKEEIANIYWDQVLTSGSAPQSVYALCKELEVTEGEFYKHFSSIDAIESDFWQTTVTETIEVLEKDEDYAEYGFEQKLLAFYYTYFAHIQKHRSRFVERFPCIGLEGMKRVAKMRTEVLEKAELWIHQGIEEGIVADRKQLNSLYSKALFEQLKVLILFYIKDDSENFQDTDAFIEKTVGLGLQCLSTGVLDSVIDVARFLVRKTPLVK